MQWGYTFIGSHFFASSFHANYYTSQELGSLILWGQIKYFTFTLNSRWPRSGCLWCRFYFPMRPQNFSGFRSKPLTFNMLLCVCADEIHRIL